MIKVFIYDDSDARKESLKTLLEFTDNMEFVGSAGNCSQITSDIENTNPDVVLMDIEMPLADGIEGVRQIKLFFPHIKVIMQTVYEDIDKIFKAFEHGAAGYILKKASIDQIIESIDKVYDGQVFITPSMALQIINNLEKFSKKDGNTSLISTIELQIIQLVAQGYSNKIIAEKMDLTEVLVNKHITAFSERLQSSAWKG
ncbi:MAG: response regulator transcription factor [Saprospiraceae bacterium]|nr:response regulator transcription factor [Saprospiraceae bacterium]MBK8854873.1 response regulator transcription factor [Saprospiraceae bacterium]